MQGLYVAELQIGFHPIGKCVRSVDMVISAPEPSRIAMPRPRGPGVQLVWASVACFGLVLLLTATVAVDLAGASRWMAFPVSGAVFGVIVLLAGRGLVRDYPHDRLGLCNRVTLLRGVCVAGLAPVLTAPDLITLPPAAAWAVTGVAALSLTLDGVDGRLARHAGLVSDFGARFDMEVDALFALVLSLLVWLTGTVGVWVLALGVMRYLYVAAGWMLPWLNGPLPEQVMRRKTVCVIQIGVLVALMGPILTPPLTTAMAGWRPCR